MQITDFEKEKLYRDFHTKVLGYMHSKLTNSHTAEDLTEDVFVKVYEKIDSFDEAKASFSTWIYTIARNTLIDYFRTMKQYEEVPETKEADYNLEDEVLDSEDLSKLAAALRTLDERSRDIIVLRFYQGKTLKDIAKQLGISYAYVKLLQNNAFVKLKEQLKDFD